MRWGVGWGRGKAGGGSEDGHGVLWANRGFLVGFHERWD